MSNPPLTAPAAPGRLGEAVDAQQMLRYLEAMIDWVQRRRRELDELDRAAQESPVASSLTQDIVLSMSLWQAVNTRVESLRSTWDSGRVGLAERERLATLIWGRLEATTGLAGSLTGANMSLPEACRLSDALVGQLREKLQMDPESDAIALRVRALRAQMERLRDQVQLEPAGPAFDAARARLSQMVSRTDDIVAKAERGGDVGGLLGPLEIESATWERDLIVGGVQRREGASKTASAHELLTSLRARRPQIEQVMAQAVAAVDPSPRYALPNVDALGEMPTDPGALDHYIARLHKVAEATKIAEGAYTAALKTRDDLVARFRSLQEQAAALNDEDITATGEATARVVERTPLQVGVATSLVDAFAAQIQEASRR